MFTLDTMHITSLLFASLICGFTILAFYGFAKNSISLLKGFVFLPVALCALSIFFPYSVIEIMIYFLFIMGLSMGIYKLRNLEPTILFNTIKVHFSKASRVEKFLIVFLFFHILSTLVGATVFGGQGTIVDAMTYHVGAPKEWSLHLGGPKLNVNNPESLTGSYFEYIQYSIFIIFKPLFLYLKSLDRTHYEFLACTLLLQAQLLTSLFGAVFIPFLISRIFKNKSYFVYLVIIMLLGMKNMTWIWRTAKNDAYPLFCALLAFYNLKKFYSSKRLSLVVFESFFILGVGLGAKMTNFYPMVAILGYLFIKYYTEISKLLSTHASKIKALSISALAGLTALLPFLLRNYLETGNPLFPTESSFFPNIYLTDATAAFHKLYSDPTTWDFAILKLQNLFKANPALIMIVFASFVLGLWKESIFFILLSILISKITGQKFMWRQISMLLFFVVFWVNILFDRYDGMTFKHKTKFTTFIFCLFIVFSQFKPERLVKYPKRKYFNTLSTIMPKQYYAWDRQLKENLKYKDDKNHLTNDSSYFSRFPHLNLTDSREELRTYYK